MDYLPIISGNQEELMSYRDIATCLEDIDQLPFLLEKIYRDSIQLDEPALDRLRFALLRLQVYADVHRNENMEQAQKIKYVGQVLEKVLFGSLLLEKETPEGD